MTNLADQGTSRLSDLVSDLEDSSDALPLLDVEASSLVVHSLHDRSSEVEVSADSHDQQLQQSSSSVAETNISSGQIVSMHSRSISSIPWALFFLKGGTTFNIHGSASSSEKSLVGILLLGGEPILSLFLSSFSFVYIGCMS